MNIKSFTAEQLYDCLVVATLRRSEPASSEDPRLMSPFGDLSRQSFLQTFRVPPGSRTDYQAGIPQALTLINGSMTSEATVETGELLQSIQAPFFTNEQRVEMLFLATLSRQPTEQEADQMLTHLASTTDDSTQAQRLGDILWTLVELRRIHIKPLRRLGKNRNGYRSTTLVTGNGDGALRIQHEWLASRHRRTVGS